MSGTRSGGAKAAATNKRKYGESFYEDIGKLSHKAWVRNGRKPRGFSVNKELASIAGARGGHISRRIKRLKEV